jgi:hypothetical protein
MGAAVAAAAATTAKLADCQAELVGSQVQLEQARAAAAVAAAWGGGRGDEGEGGTVSIGGGGGVGGGGVGGEAYAAVYGAMLGAGVVAAAGYMALTFGVKR